MIKDNIYIVDAIAGSGKSTAIINMINNCTSEKRFLYVTPFLKEVERIIEECPKKNFIQPDKKTRSKKGDIYKLISKGNNIVTTHALFQSFTPEIKELIYQQDYTLVLDEVCNVVENVAISKHDLKNILESFAHVNDDNLIEWDVNDYNGKFDNYKTMADNKSLLVYQDAALMWKFPIEVFRAFEKVYILTYMFDCQMQKYYYDYYGVIYNYLSVKHNVNDKGIIDRKSYALSTLSEAILPEYTKTLKNNINIVDNDKINSVGESITRSQPLSASWFKRQTDHGADDMVLIDKLKSHLYNYFRNIAKGNSTDNMWTTFKSHKQLLSGNGYTKGFVALGARATNQYMHKKNLAYCANIFINPILKQFFALKDIKINESKYALSELVQWAWRSQISLGEPITIYIPSYRMRTLFIEWINEFNE